MEKEYLGDSVYAEFVGSAIRLTTEDGSQETNVIFLEQSTYAALKRFVKRILKEQAAAQED